MRAILTCATAALTFCLALVPKVHAQDNCIHPRIISVTGTAEIKVAPDEVTLTLGVESRNRDLALAKASNDRRVKRLLALAHDAGLDPKYIQTSALTMGPEYSEEKIPKLLGYQISQTVTVSLTDLSKYETLITSFLKAGVNRMDGINFGAADSLKYRQEARLKAIQAAREKATAMAAELGQKIGKPWEVAEEIGYDTSYFANSISPYRAKMAPMQEMEPTIAGGEVTTRASVRVSFQLE